MTLNYERRGVVRETVDLRFRNRHLNIDICENIDAWVALVTFGCRISDDVIGSG